MNREALICELTRDEGKRFVAYDDATGKPIKPGSVVVGHVTIGVGRALDVNPLDEVEVRWLLNYGIDKTVASVIAQLPWASTLDDSRYRVLVNMAFNMGITGLLGFKNMLAAAKSGDYATAAAEMKSSKWYAQVGSRAERLADMMESGTPQ